jgi:hypothetical protein
VFESNRYGPNPSRLKEEGLKTLSAPPCYRANCHGARRAFDLVGVIERASFLAKT